MKISRKHSMLATGGAAASLTVGSIATALLIRSNEPAKEVISPIPKPARPQELVYLSSRVNRAGKWGADQLFEFVNSLSDVHLNPLGKALEVDGFEAKTKALKFAAVHEEILWQSSSIFTYSV